MTWWDGFVVALANPGFLIAALGGLDRGPRHNRRVRPVDDLGPDRRAPEQRPRRAGDDVPGASPAASPSTRTRRGASTSPVGPVATFGYWFAWSSVLAINGLVVGTLIQARVVLGHDVDATTGRLRPDPADLHRHRLHHRRLALQHLRRATRGVVRLRHRRGADPPRVRADVPALPHGGLVERQHAVGDRRRRRARARSHLALLHGVVVVRLRDGGGLRARVPRPRARHTGALRAAAAFSVLVYALLPLGLGGTLGTAAIADDATFIAFYTQAFDSSSATRSAT